METLQDARWAALTRRDAAQDGRFVYSVRTTGVYCKPSCAARTPRPENVAFHATCAEAEAAGFRPCRRCRPNESGEAHAALIARLCRWMEAAEVVPRLDEMASEAGMSESYFHRVFKKHTGLTPRGFAAAARARRVRTALGGQGTVTAALYASGYNSNGRFYAEAEAVLGMTPTAFRAGGANAVVRFAVGECTLGTILVARSERGVCAILLGDDAETLVRSLQDQFPRAELWGGDAGFEELVAKVVGLVEAPGVGLELPLDIRGTAFQQRVWEALRKIPAGTTLSYSEVARAMGEPAAVRAVARACAANVLAVAIPCHRVVRHDGALSGYRWGVERKRALLEREARA
jgi:AraC family transcriptional regulator of adaptative response/methylated-DNA-[protein]-cysteine methyltransferase